MTCCCSQGGLGHVGRDDVAVMVSPPDWYCTTSIKSHYPIFGSGLFGSLKSGGFNDPASESSKAQNLLDTQLGGSTADVIILMSNSSMKATDPAFTDAATQLLATIKARP